MEKCGISSPSGLISIPLCENTLRNGIQTWGSISAWNLVRSGKKVWGGPLGTPRGLKITLIGVLTIFLGSIPLGRMIRYNPTKIRLNRTGR